MQHIHHFPEWENWLIEGYLLGKSERQNSPGHKEQQMWPCPPLLVYWGAQRPIRNQGAVLTWGTVTATQSHAPLVTLNYFSGSKHYQNAFLPHTGSWGWTGPQDPQEGNEAAPTSAPRLTLLHSPSRPCGCFMPSRAASAKPTAWLRTESCQSHPRLLELELLNNLQHEALQPSCQPICFLKDYFKHTGKNASVFSNNFVWHDLKSHNFRIWSTNVWSPLTCNTHGSSSQPSAPPILCAGLPPLATQSPLSWAQRRAKVSSCNCIKWQHSSKHTASTVGNL